MKTFTKAAFGALMLAGAAIGTAAPAAAHVSVGIGIGVPGPGYGPGYYGRDYGGPAYCDPYSRWYDPYRCDDYDDDGYYNGPVFIDGIWLNGGFRSRYYGGHREFYYHGGWHGGSGFHQNGFGHGGGGGHWSGGGGHGGGGHWGGHHH
jgi:hypothetical protein